LCNSPDVVVDVGLLNDGSVDSGFRFFSRFVGGNDGFDAFRVFVGCDVTFVCEGVFCAVGMGNGQGTAEGVLTGDGDTIARLGRGCGEAIVGRGGGVGDATVVNCGEPTPSLVESRLKRRVRPLTGGRPRKDKTR